MAATSYTLSHKFGNLSAYTRLNGNTAQKLVYKDDRVSGLRRVFIKSTDLLKAMKEVSGVTKTYEAGDKFAVLPVGKGEYIEWVMLYTHVADAAAVNPTIGDSGTAAGWSPAISMNSTGAIEPSCAAGTFLTVATTPVAMGKLGKFYTADDAVVVTLGATLPTRVGSAGTAEETGGALVFEVIAKYTQVFPNSKIAPAALI